MSNDGPGYDRGQLFEVARRMVAAGVVFVQDLYGGPMELASRRLGLNVEEVFTDLSQMLAEVATDPGADALAEAMAQADRLAARTDRPFVRPDRSRSYPRAAALAYCLSERHGRRSWFAFPAERIGDWLGLGRDAAGVLIRQLDADGVIRLRRDENGKATWNHKTGDAREAKFTGPKPGLTNPEV